LFADLGTFVFHQRLDVPGYLGRTPSIFFLCRLMYLSCSFLSRYEELNSFVLPSFAWFSLPVLSPLLNFPPVNESSFFFAVVFSNSASAAGSLAGFFVAVLVSDDRQGWPKDRAACPSGGIFVGYDQDASSFFWRFNDSRCTCASRFLEGPCFLSDARYLPPHTPCSFLGILAPFRPHPKTRSPFFFFMSYENERRSSPDLLPGPLASTFCPSRGLMTIFQDSALFLYF